MSQSANIKAATRTRRHFLALALLPALAVAAFGTASVALPTHAEALTSAYWQGYNKGKSVGRQHGYTDGYKGAYKASYVDELINGGGYSTFGRKSNSFSADYVRGYKNG